jgi:hypothetical protein
MEEILARGFMNLLGRLDGPMHIRFIVQPAVALLLGVRAGVEDARGGEPPFFTGLWHSAHRRKRLRQAWDDIRRVFVIAAVIDAVYQTWVQRAIFFLELLVTATLLALVPYALVRGPACRVARAWLVLSARRRVRKP